MLSPFSSIRNNLLEYSWKLSTANGETISDRLRFLDNGAFYGCIDLFNVKWKIDGNALTFWNHEGKHVATFDHMFQSGPKPLILIGREHQNGEIDPGLYLTPISPCRGASTASFQSRIPLNGKKDVLLVIFNSLGIPFDGYNTHWEFYDLPHRLDVSHVNFAQISSSLSLDIQPTWYLDRIEEVCNTLSGLLSQGYSTCILCGGSSGGYASLLFSEILCRSFPNVTFRTFSINPQTVLSEKHQSYLELAIDREFLAARINHDHLAKRGLVAHDIPEVIRTEPQNNLNIKHHVFFDSLNPAENYHTGQIKDFSSVQLHPLPLGLPHVQSCAKFHEAQILEKGVALAVEGARQALVSPLSARRQPVENETGMEASIVKRDLPIDPSLPRPQKPATRALAAS